MSFSRAAANTAMCVSHADRLSPQPCRRAAVRESGGESEGRGDRAQPLKRLTLDLAASLLADPQRRSDLRVAAGALFAQPVPPNENQAVALGKPVEHLPQLAAPLAGNRPLGGIRPVSVCDQFSEGRRV